MSNSYTKPVHPANRHERRRATKVGEHILISAEDFRSMPSLCAWGGCGASTLDVDGAGWSKMVLYSGETHANFLDINPRRMARDCVLCPTHARQLDEQVLIDIGGRMRCVEGTA